jgi:tetratricopeptide (TPR) repeat protein
MMMKSFWILFVMIGLPLLGMAEETISPAKLRTLYNRMDPLSISQHLAFYELYPESAEGKEALREAWKLLSGNREITPGQHVELTATTPEALKNIVDLVNKPINEGTPLLTREAVSIIEQLTAHLPHRRLKGHFLESEEEVLKLSPGEIDLARGLFLSQLRDDPEMLHKTISYESMLDLMALQILTKISLQAPALDKVRAINHFIFYEIGFRFPPHSLYAKDVDLYTFLPSVLDSRRGVCLGVSILYLALAQRLGLPLEIITPPGHIFLRYRVNPDEVVNIETTARGIHIDSKEYLGVDTRALEQRNIKDVIGLAHFNQASVYWQRQEYDKARQSHLRASRYLPDDMLLKELMGYDSLLLGDEKEAKRLLNEVKDHIPEHAVSRSTVPQDLLDGKGDVEGLRAVFMPVDETRESIIKKKEAIENSLKNHPQFKSALFNLAIAHLQLHRADAALEVLKHYHEICPDDISAEYYLGVLYAQRLDYNKAWEHLQIAEKLARARDYDPKILKDMHKELSMCCPE